MIIYLDMFATIMLNLIHCKIGRRNIIITQVTRKGCSVSCTMYATAQYVLFSMKDLVTMGWFFEHQEMRFSPRENRITGGRWNDNYRENQPNNHLSRQS